MSFVIDPVFGCHLSTGRQDREGYAFHGKTRAHIAAWVEANGPVPEGFEIEHTCRRRHCRELRHLRLVTRRQNEHLKALAHRARLEQCPRGHSLIENRRENAAVTPEGGVTCRICNREALQQQGQTT